MRSGIFLASVLLGVGCEATDTAGAGGGPDVATASGSGGALGGGSDPGVTTQTTGTSSGVGGGWGVVFVDRVGFLGSGVEDAVGLEVGAEFAHEARPSGCEGTPFGDCIAYADCAAGDAPTTFLSAGSLTLEGLGEPIEMTPSASDGRYLHTSSLSEDPFVVGSTVTARAAGDAVPSFASSTVVHDRLRVDLASGDGPSVIVREQGFDLSWTGGAADGDLVVAFTSGDGGGAVVCTAPVTAGALHVSPDALLQLPPGADGDVTVLAGTTSTTTVGDWTFETQLNDLVVPVAPITFE